MKKLLTIKWEGIPFRSLLTTLLLVAAGFLHAQDFDVYTCGVFTNTYGKDAAGVYKNGTLKWSFGNAEEHYSTTAVAVDPDTKDVYWTVSYHDYDYTYRWCNIYKNGDLYLDNNNQTEINELCFYEGHLYALGKRKHSESGRVEFCVWKDNNTNPLFTMYDGETLWNSIIQTPHFCIAGNSADDGAIYVACPSLQYGFYQGENQYYFVTEIYKYTFTLFDCSLIYTVPGRRVQDIAYYDGNVYTACEGFKSENSRTYIYKNNELLYEKSYNYIANICVESGDVYALYTGSDWLIYKNGTEYIELPTNRTSTMFDVNSFGVFTNTQMSPYGIYKGDTQLFTLPAVPKAMTVLCSCEDEYTRSLPFIDNFEMGDTEWECWAKRDVDANYNPNNDGEASFWDRSGTNAEIGPYAGSHCARHKYNIHTAQNGYLVTPKLFLQPNRSSTQLSFKSYEDFPTSSGFVAVSISTTGNYANNFTDIWTRTNFVDNWKTFTIDLSDYQGQAVYIAFHYGGQDGCDWYIDNVTITESDEQCNTQTTLPYSETFDDGIDCWYVRDLDMSGGQKCWQWNSDEQCAYHPWGQQGIPQTGWLFSRPISLAETGYNYTLSFKSKSTSSGTGQRNSVWIAVDKPASHSPYTSDYTEIWVDPNYSGSWKTYDIDLSDYAGHTVNIAFKYEGTYAHNWFIDDFSISKEAINDNVITIGSGTATSTYLPTWTHYEFSMTQQIYTASEIGGACTIEKIAFYNTDVTRTRIIDIYMKNTTKGSFSSNTDWITAVAADKVYSGGVTFTAGQWTEITLDTPFAYDGTNLAVIVDDDTDLDGNSAEFLVFNANGNQALRIASAFSDFNPISPSGTGYTMNVKNQIKLFKSSGGGGGGGNELTVYPDGTETNNQIPMYVYYFDDFTRSQHIIPASELTAMNGAQITAIKYYTDPGNVPYTTDSEVDIYLKEVSGTTISSFVDKSTAQIVYHGTVNFVTEGNHGEATITFTTPFAYNGGNLMVGCDNTTDVDYKNIYFYGENGHTGAAIYGSNTTSLANVTPTASSFLPKTTFTYTPGGSGGTITEVYVDGFTAPVWGTHPDFDVTVPDGAHYTIDQVLWEHGDVIMQPEDVFDLEETNYYMTVYLMPESGYAFDPNTTVYFNGDASLCDDYYNEIYDDGRLEASTIDFQVTNSGTTTQATNFVTGWNWWSSYIEANDLMNQLKTGLGTSGQQIKSQTQYTQYNAMLNMWIGQLNSLNNESMYMIQTNAACSTQLTGNEANPASHTITLNPGWNWIGFPNSEATPIATAFANITPANQDQVKSQNGYATYNSMLGMWIGNLNTLNPGTGLQYLSKAGSPVSLVYHAARNVELAENVTNENNHWTNDVHAYPDNMTVTAVVELDDVELQSESYEVAAFANGECRGSARLMFVAPLDRYMAFLTIAGDEASELHFSLYDAQTGNVETCHGASLQYETNAIVGDVETPYVISFRSTTGIDELDGRINVFPNPVSRGENITIGLPVVETLRATSINVEIINAFGQVVESVYTPTVQTIAAPNTAGVYTLRITVEGKGTYTRKLVVR